jgi:hypothetical protein
MTTTTGDAACLSALAAQIGHPPPFSDAELAAVAALTITHPRDLAPIEGCSGLRHLRIIAGELEDLMVLDEKAELTHLELHATRIGALLGAASCERLERVDVLFTSLEDASDLLGIASWKRGVVVGNPWNDNSWGALQHQAERPDRFFELSPEPEWRRIRRLWQRAEACCGYLDYALLVRPGLPVHTQNAYDALRVSMGTIGHELNQADFSLAKMFQDYQSRIEAPDLSELAASRTLGTAADARGWIAASALPEADKAALDRFVQRFPVTFYRANEAALDRDGSAHGLELPTRYRALRATLDGWMPAQSCPPVRFDRFEGWSPRADDVGVLTYDLGLRQAGADVREALREAGFAIVGLSLEQPQSTLAIRTAGDDPQVYEYSEEDISDAMSEHRDIASSIRPVFPSYAAMLDHVVSIHPRGGEPIAARGGS